MGESQDCTIQILICTYPFGGRRACTSSRYDPRFHSSMGWAALITKSFHVTKGAYWMILLYKVQKQAKFINGEKDSHHFEEKGLILGKGQESNFWDAAGKVLALGGGTWVCSFWIIHQAVHL